MKSVVVKLEDMQDMLSIVECQRDISVRLSIIKKNIASNNEHLKIIKGLSNKLVDLKLKHRENFTNLTLNKDEIKEVNKLLKDRHIKLEVE